VLARSSGNVTFEKVATGEYLVHFQRNVFEDCSRVVSLGAVYTSLPEGNPPENAIGFAYSSVYYDREYNGPAFNSVQVDTFDKTGARADKMFHLAVFC
jgi:hypothetical protein